jgi:hypothetical protein
MEPASHTTAKRFSPTTRQSNRSQPEQRRLTLCEKEKAKHLAELEEQRTNLTELRAASPQTAPSEAAEAVPLERLTV